MIYNLSMKMFGLGLLVHLILLLSIFDIHFKTPILSNVEPIVNELPAPAKRLVLFSGDGIRADTFFTMKSGRSNAPFLRSIIETTGVWGVSNAHVPTESRTGHVAMIAGMYEDPSAIFKGWQNYVVDFDSLLNQSYASFSFGSPDTLNIFSRGSNKVNSFNYMYSADKQQFSGTNNSAVSLTYWVADQFDLFLDSLEGGDSRLYNIVNSDKIMFFFHFLGPDIAGHTAKPKSQEYIDNIFAVDQCIKRMQNSINAYFKDDKTAFVFTSDHGMTDWGSHGDGSPEETLTPIVTWGAGLSAPIKVSSVQNGIRSGIDIPADWHLSDYYKIEINQADITPLMAVLIGISIPVNSIGILPTRFLREDIEWTLKAVVLNIYQLKAQYDVHHYSVKSKLFDVFYEKFEEPDFTMCLQNSSDLTDNVKELYLNNALKACSQYLKGIEFYRNYYSTFLLGLLCLLYIGWILNLGIEIISRSKIAGVVFSYNYHYVHGISRWDDAVRVVAISVTIITLILLIGQGLPINFYVYSLLTISIWWNVIPCWKQVLSTLHLVSIHPVKLYIYCMLFFFGLELLVFGFKWRSTICIAVLGLQFLWIVEEGWNFRFHRIFAVYLITSCVVGIFPLLPTVGAYKNIFIVFISGILWFAYRFITAYIQKELRQPEILLQLILIFVATLNTVIIDRSFSLKHGLYLLNQAISWAVLGLSIITLKFGPKLLYPNYIFISNCLSAPFILLTTGHEALFLCLLSCHLFIWTFLEFHGFQEISKESYDFVMWGPKSLKYGDFRIAFFFFTYCLLGFFGIGNFASLNSFDPAWVRGFITMFSPITMTLLITFKTIIPIFMVTCALRVIIPTCQESVQRIFLCVLLFCDIVGFNFFLTVTNQGSWMEIGTSLTKFILLDVLTIVLLAFYAISAYLMPLERDDKEVQEFTLDDEEVTNPTFL